MVGIPQTKLSSTFQNLVNWLGSFWRRVYVDPAFIRDMQACRALWLAQHDLDLNENLKLEDRKNAPVFHRERWYPVTIYKSEAGTGKIGQITIGSGNVRIGTQQDPAYVADKFDIGKNAKFANIVTYPIHGQVDGVMTCIVDNYIKPKVILRNGIDYLVKDDSIAIIADKDPFGDRSTFLKDVTEDAEDVETVLWACDAVIEKGYVNKHLGYIIDTTLPEGDYGKSILNSYWDSVNYTNYGNLSALVGTLCDVPYVLDDEETVEHVGKDFVITDKNTYKFRFIPVFRNKTSPGVKFVHGEFFDTSIRIVPFVTDVDRIQGQLDYSIKDAIPKVHIPSSITNSGIGFSAGWDEMSLADFSNEYGVPLETCSRFTDSDRIVPAKFFLEAVVGHNTQFIFIDFDKIANASIYEERFFRLLRNTIPDYIRIAVMTKLERSDDYSSEDMSESIGLSVATGVSESISGQTEKIRYRFTSKCAKT